MKKKHVPASIGETAFTCPHCGALTSHTWYTVYAKELGDGKTPFFPSDDILEHIRNSEEINIEDKGKIIDRMSKLKSGMVFLDENVNDIYRTNEVINIYISHCFNCQKIIVWIYDKLLFPPELHGEEPNIDIPDDILRDYEEARSILNLSPRGSAALLRLVIQKICIYLGEDGKNINNDIASLVKKGLSPIIQQALDVVRVVGNDAVHPGILDLRDDRDTASKLFRLINLISERMISHPKHVRNMYDTLVPESKKKQIEDRDSKKS